MPKVLTEEVLASLVQVTGWSVTPGEGSNHSRIGLSTNVTEALMKALQSFDDVYHRDEKDPKKFHRANFSFFGLDIVAKACELRIWVNANKPGEKLANLHLHVNECSKFELVSTKDGLELRFQASTTTALVQIADFLDAVTGTACQMRLIPLEVQKELPLNTPGDVEREAAKVVQVINGKPPRHGKGSVN